jgi:hypothetical protein
MTRGNPIQVQQVYTLLILQETKGDEVYIIGTFTANNNMKLLPKFSDKSGKYAVIHIKPCLYYYYLLSMMSK